MKLQTKWIEIPCLIPEHRKYLWGEYKNICGKLCHANQKLVCANCESQIIVNEKAEQECQNCKVK